MEKQLSKSLDPFSNMDISSLEEGLGLIINKPASGDAGKKTDEKSEPPKTELKLPIIGNKIQIPETEEEIKQFGASKLVDTESSKDDVEEEEVKDKTKKQGEKEDVDINEDSPLYLHAATLHEEGILPTLDLESLKGKKHSEVVKAIIDAQKEFIDKGRESYKESLTTRQVKFLDYIEKGIPEEEAENQLTIEDAYGKITDELLSSDEELQENMIIQNYKLKGIADSKIKSFIKAAKEDERLFEEAKDARTDINSYITKLGQERLEKAQKDQAEAIEKDERLKKDIKTTIEATSEILPGIKLTTQEKSKLLNYMTNPVGEIVVDGQHIPVNLINKTRSEDRINFDLRLNYLIDQGLFKKDFDLSKLNKKLTSSAAEKLSTKLREESRNVTEGLKYEKSKEQKRSDSIVFPKFS